MSMKFLARLLVVMMMVQGVSVQAVQVGTTIAPDKAFYRPGEAVTLAIQTNRPQAIADSYRRFMMNKLRERFGLDVPIRMVFRQKQGNRRPPRKKDER